MVSTVPTLRHERVLMREGASMVIGCDEVGRGALAGPVGVGLSVVPAPLVALTLTRSICATSAEVRT